MSAEEPDRRKAGMRFSLFAAVAGIFFIGLVALFIAYLLEHKNPGVPLEWRAFILGLYFFIVLFYVTLLYANYFILKKPLETPLSKFIEYISTDTREKVDRSVKHCDNEGSTDSYESDGARQIDEFHSQSPDPNDKGSSNS